MSDGNTRPGLFDFAGQKAETAAALCSTTWEEVAAFIGPNAEAFRATWEDMRASAEAGKYRLPWGFCWPALFLGFAWFFYRKLWGIGALVLVAPVVVGLLTGSSPGSLGAMIAIAMFAKGFYIQHAVRKIGTAKGQGVAAVGGISIPGAILGGILLLLGLVGSVLTMLAPPVA